MIKRFLSLLTNAIPGVGPSGVGGIGTSKIQILSSLLNNGSVLSGDRSDILGAVSQFASQNILREADGITSIDRDQTYGSPDENHAITATMWSSYLQGKYGIEDFIDTDDVCFLNILQKVSRSCHQPGHRDNLVDIAGYARNAEMARQKLAQKVSDAIIEDQDGLELPNAAFNPEEDAPASIKKEAGESMINQLGG